MEQSHSFFNSFATLSKHNGIHCAALFHTECQEHVSLPFESFFVHVSVTLYSNACYGPVGQDTVRFPI
jgi:hypothetical protein